MQFKHYIADYLLQTEKHMAKFKATGWFWALLDHAMCHFCFTYVIVYTYSKNAPLTLCLALFDAVIHFTMDRIKASGELLGRYKALSATEYLHCMGVLQDCQKLNLPTDWIVAKRLKDNKMFWWLLGLDQLVHHLTDIAVIAIMLYVKN